MMAWVCGWLLQMTWVMADDGLEVVLEVEGSDAMHPLYRFVGYEGGAVTRLLLLQFGDTNRVGFHGIQ